MNPLLSILICTIPGREQKFQRLLSELRKQSEGHPVEILWDTRPAKSKGGPSIGEKRQSLLLMASGRYVCYFDDDDMPSEDYIESILSAADRSPDVISFKLLCHFKGGPVTAVHSIRYAWKENVDGYRYVRSPHHLTPVLRDIALQVGFKDRIHGEDHDYSRGLFGKLKSEVFIDRHLYDYLYTEESARTKYGTR